MKNSFIINIKCILILVLLNSEATLANQANVYNVPNNLGYEARSKLKKIYYAIGLIHEAPKAIKILDLLSESWSKYDTETKWENSLGGALCPLELSLTFKGNEELPIVRFLVEPQTKPFTIQSGWEAGMKLKKTLKALPGVDLSRFDKIYNLFSPSAYPQIPSTSESFSIWYAADTKGKEPQLKVYLNPRIHGEKKAYELIQKALTILHNKHACNFLFSRLVNNTDSKLAFLSLDLSTGVRARTKVYVANKLINNIENQLEGSLYYMNGTASSFIKTLINKEDFFNMRPIMTTFNFTMENDSPVPTIHIPIDVYVKNDQIILERLNKILSPNQIKILRTVIASISKIPLESRSSFSYISFRPLKNGQFDITCYLTL